MYSISIRDDSCILNRSNNKIEGESVGWYFLLIIIIIILKFLEKKNNWNSIGREKNVHLLIRCHFSMPKIRFGVMEQFEVELISMSFWSSLVVAAMGIKWKEKKQMKITSDAAKKNRWMKSTKCNRLGKVIYKCWRTVISAQFYDDNWSTDRRTDKTHLCAFSSFYLQNGYR